MASIPSSAPRKATRITTVTALGLVLLKLAVGWYAGSVAVLASAADSFLDFLVSSFNSVAVRSAEKPQDEFYNYGRGKMEGLAAALEGLFILGSAVFIVREAVLKLLHPQPLSHSGLAWAMAVMALALGITWILVAYLHRTIKTTRNLVLEADTLHYRTDLFSNAAVLLAMMVIRFTGWNIVDPLLALGVSAYIAKASLPLIRKGLDMLLDRSLPEALVQQIRNIAENHSPLVNGVHEIKTRRSGDINFVEFHLVFDEDITLGAAHRVTDEIEMLLRALEKSKWAINIHLDPVDDSKRDQKLTAQPNVGPLLGLLLAFVMATATFANPAASPVGRWKTFDDHTGQAKSIVSIYLDSGDLRVRVDSLLPAPGKDPNKICAVCPGERKGKRIRGMVVGWGLKPHDGAWEDGRILDPENGKIYRCRIKVNPDGKTLTVRGYIGVTWLGRSQKWERVE